jgi:FKBP-type peptidyl-prolyl cis-trans isomerase FklB
MKLKQTALLVLGLLPLVVTAQTNKPQTPVPPSNLHAAPPSNLQLAPPSSPHAMLPPATMPEKGKLSYAIGMFFGNNITNAVQHGEIPVDNEAMLQAIGDVVNGKPTKLTTNEVTSIMNQLRMAISAKKKQEEEELEAKSKAFLAQFKLSPGAITLSNGLAYKVLKEGNGPMPTANDTVVVNYRGTFVDGKEFDHHDNFTTPMHGRIIQGWQQVLPLMKVHSKWQVVIPPNLAYGPRGMPPKIPGNATLVFDLELVSFTAGPTFPPAAPPPPTSSAPKTPPPPTTAVVSGEIIKVPSADELKKGAKIEVIKAGQTNAINSQ